MVSLQRAPRQQPPGLHGDAHTGEPRGVARDQACTLGVMRRAMSDLSCDITIMYKQWGGRARPRRLDSSALPTPLFSAPPGKPRWLSWERIRLQCGSPGLGRSPGEGKGYPLHYSGLENSTDCKSTGSQSWTQLSDFHFHFGLPSCASGEEPTCQCRRHMRRGFHRWVGKRSWRRKWQPTPVSSPREFHEEPGGLQSMESQSQTRLTSHACTHIPIAGLKSLFV